MAVLRGAFEAYVVVTGVVVLAPLPDSL